MSLEVTRKVQVWIYRKASGTPSQGPVEVLILKLTPERGGFWQPVTGGVEEGEDIGRAPGVSIRVAWSLRRIGRRTKKIRKNQSGKIPNPPWKNGVGPGPVDRTPMRLIID